MSCLSTIRTSFPQAIPGEPYFIFPGGNGLERIGELVSVSPMVSMMGTPYFCSNWMCISGAKGAEAERPNRKYSFITSFCSPESSVLCNSAERRVGTTLNQVQRYSRIQPQNSEVLNFGGMKTLLPLTKGPIMVLIKPLI